MKKIIAAVIAATMVLASGGAFAFTDMADSEASLLLERLGVISGYEDGSFRPDNTVTRAEAVTTIVRAVDIRPEISLYEYENMVRTGKYRGGANVTSFADYDANHWANVYIQAGISEGIISGFEDNTFRPSDNVTIEQLFVMTLGAVGYGDLAAAAGGFPDGYIKYAKSTGIANNISGTDYSRAATRREVMTCAANMLRAPLAQGGGYTSLLTEDGYIYEAEAVVTDITERDNAGNRIASAAITSSRNYAGQSVSAANPINTTVIVPYELNVKIETGKKYKMYVNCYNEKLEDGYLMVCVLIEQ